MDREKLKQILSNYTVPEKDELESENEDLRNKLEDEGLDY
jgi:hypothetical protein